MKPTTAAGFPIAYPAVCQWGHRGAVKTAADPLPCLAQAERRVNVGLAAAGKTRAMELCPTHLRALLDDAEASGAIVQ